jgi:hypothetical protein
MGKPTRSSPAGGGGAQVVLRRDKPVGVQIEGIVLHLVDVGRKQVELVASGPQGTLVLKKRCKRTGNLVLTLVGGGFYPSTPDGTPASASNESAAEMQTGSRLRSA